MFLSIQKQAQQKPELCLKYVVDYLGYCQIIVKLKEIKSLTM